jgi:hypothetical protein
VEILPVHIIATGWGTAIAQEHLRNGHIFALDSARKHMDVLISEPVEQGFGKDDFENDDDDF